MTTTGEHPALRWVALAALVGANLVVFASVTLVSVALPQARQELALSASESQLVITLYGLGLGPLVLLGGRLGDVLGLRRTLLLGLGGFAAASAVGGCAAHAEVLLAARLAQGATGALVAASAVPLLSTVFPRGRSRQTAFAVLGVAMGLGTGGSFLVGGALVGAASWRWCLLVNVPVTGLLALAVALAAPRVRAERVGVARARVDVRGALVVCVSLAALVAGLDRAAVHGWGHALALGLLVTGAATAALVPVALRRAEQPLVPEWLLRDRVRGAGVLAALSVGAATFGGLYLLGGHLQEVRGLGPVRTGLALLPFAVGAVAAVALLGALRRRLRAGALLALGLLAAALAQGLLGPLEPGTPYALGVLPAAALLGAGCTLVMTAASDVATAGAGGDTGVAGSLVSASQQVGAALGTGLLVSVARAAGPGAGSPAAAGLDVAGPLGAALVAGTALLVLLVRDPAEGGPAGRGAPVLSAGRW